MRLLVLPVLLALGTPPAEAPVAPDQRKTAVEGLAKALRAHYVSPELAERTARQALARQNFGISKAEVLPGNVGLLDLRFFAPAEFSSGTLTAAMALLSGTDALIIDLRQNDGGDPETIAYLCTYFFPVGSRIHLN